MTLQGLIAAQNLADVTDKEKAWDNLGAGIGAVIQSTNSIRNNTMAGAVAGTPGTLPTNWVFENPIGLSSSIVGTGVDDGISYIDIRFSGSVAAGTSSRELVFYWESFTAIPVVRGQTWTHSCYAKIVAGSLTGIAGGRLYLIGTSFGEIALQSFDYSSLTESFAKCRVSQTYAFIQDTTTYVAPRIDVIFTRDANDIDFTLRIGMPQMQQGAFLTPPIPTVNAAVSALVPISFTIKGKDILALNGVNKTSTLYFSLIKGLADSAQSRITAAAQNAASGATLSNAALLRNSPSSQGDYINARGAFDAGTLKINGIQAASLSSSPFSGSTASFSCSISTIEVSSDFRLASVFSSGTIASPKRAVSIETDSLVLYAKAGQS